MEEAGERRKGRRWIQGLKVLCFSCSEILKQQSMKNVMNSRKAQNSSMELYMHNKMGDKPSVE